MTSVAEGTGEPLTLREALVATTRPLNDEPFWENETVRGVHQNAIEVAFKELGLQPELADWQERVAEADEMARLDRLLPDGWGFTLTFGLSGWHANAGTRFVGYCIGNGLTRLEALRALNDELERRASEGKL